MSLARSCSACQDGAWAKYYSGLFFLESLGKTEVCKAFLHMCEDVGMLSESTAAFDPGSKISKRKWGSSMISELARPNFEMLVCVGADDK